MDSLIRNLNGARELNRMVKAVMNNNCSSTLFSLAAADTYSGRYWPGLSVLGGGCPGIYY